jgi:translation initiation factor 2 alpha subunit (eIF-2alpha)
MKTYKIVLLTKSGLKRKTYKDFQSLESFENQMIRKYGDFYHAFERRSQNKEIKAPINYQCND